MSASRDETARASNDSAGSVFAEYAVLLALVSVGCVLAALTLGPPLLRNYLMQRAILLLPIPA
jgi:Flp pilus assembly pilin Flp